MRKKKTALITDLDNTLFDWVDLWLICFSSLLDGLVKVSGIPREKLIPEIRAIHQRHGTSEYSFLIEEIPSLGPVLKGQSATDVFAEPIESYRRLRRQHLRLYSNVGETLLKVKGRGTLIIGYTESMAFYSNYRVRRLGLDGVLDHVFYPEDHVLPGGLSPEDVRKYPPTHYELRYTRQHFTPKGSTKPDSDVINAIVRDLGLSKANSVYVGDSLMKDVAMALDSGIDDVWAKYGLAHKRKEYRLLQEVSHWTEDQVEQEQRIEAKIDVTPSYTLESTFSEILDMFEFDDFLAPRPKRS